MPLSIHLATVADGRVCPTGHHRFAVAAASVTDLFLQRQRRRRPPPAAAAGGGGGGSEGGSEGELELVALSEPVMRYEHTTQRRA